MIIWFMLLLSMATFFVSFYFLNAKRTSIEILKVSNKSLQLLQNKNINEHELEKAVQENAIQLFRLFFIITAKMTCIFVLTLAVLLVPIEAGVYSLGDLKLMLASPAFISISGLSFVVLIIYFYFNK